jgi:hypothetical protein
VYVFRYSPEASAADVPFASHTAQTLLVVTVTSLVAVLLPEVQVVFGLVGALIAPLNGIVMPGLMALATRSQDDPPWRTPLGYVAVVAGAIFTVISTAVSIVKLL